MLPLLGTANDAQNDNSFHESFCARELSKGMVIIMAQLEYKCPNCGAPLGFEPGTQEMTCEHCGTVMDIAALQCMDEEVAAHQEPDAAQWEYEGTNWEANEAEGMGVYTCNSCGGEIVGDETMGAATCPFCGNPVVLTAKFSGALRPDIVIPFKLDRAKALASLENHYAKKKLLPTVFKDRNHLQEVKGVYVPFWLFSADADGRFEYRATRIRRWSDARFHYTETSFFRVIRGGTLGFDAVPVDGSKSIDNTMMESLEPFNMNETEEFKPAYLAGFCANKYDVEAGDCAPRANQRIKNTTTNEFNKTVMGYHSVTPVNASVNVKCEGVRYALLPVWMLGSTWEGKNFTFSMNGQTGKFVGDLPLDKSARNRWFLKLFGIIAASLLVLTQVVITFM